MEFDRGRLNILPLNERIHDLTTDIILPLKKRAVDHQELIEIAECIKNAKKKNRAIMMFMGGHVICSGTQNYIIDLMKKGYLSCLAMNGAGLIHDFEFALIGATTENVAHYIKNGQFGLWRETGRINDVINEGYLEGLGMGQAAGKAIAEGDFPYQNISILANGYNLGIPVTIHVGIGYDIIHEHPNCDGAATGATSYRDFLRFVKIIEKLEGGVIMNFGSAVMAPEVFLKALSMARNVAYQEGRIIKHFTTLVCDLHSLPGNIRGEPEKDDAFYYFRPWKTMLVRTVADGGESYYVKGKHEETIPALWTAINKAETK